MSDHIFVDLVRVNDWLTQIKNGEDVKPSPEVLKALDDVLDYNWADELTHYQATVNEETGLELDDDKAEDHARSVK